MTHSAEATIVRVSDLTDDSSRYDRFIAAPPDNVRRIMWIIWAVVAATAGLYTLVLFLAILVSRKIREKPFNAYLLFLMFPDFFFSLNCAITCILNAMKGDYYSDWMCKFQHFYVTFGIGGNAWINVLVTYQLHKMMRLSAQRRRYTPPLTKQVALQCWTVYMYVAFLSIWGVIDTDWDPFYSDKISGLACLPAEYDKKSTWFFWLLFFPLFVGIPMFYVLFVCCDICKRKLLPPQGKRRTLTIYFGRLVLVFLVMWLPTFFMMFITTGWTSSAPWVRWAGGLWSHLQAALSSALSTMKPDITLALKKFVSCGCCEDYEDEIDDIDFMASIQAWSRRSSSRLKELFRTAGSFQFDMHSEEEEDFKKEEPEIGVIKEVSEEEESLPHIVKVASDEENQKTNASTYANSVSLRDEDILDTEVRNI